MTKKLYDKNSIESLSPLEFTRLKAGVYCGDTANPNQLLIEIISNAIDECRAGHGNKIEVTIDKDVVSVRDYGQGFLINEKREDGKTILEAAFSVLNTSGKYRENGTYEGTSLGSFGIGTKLTNFLAHWLEVITYRDAQYEHLWFKEGVFFKREVGESSSPSGTCVKWQASEEFFGTNIIDIKPIKTLFKTLVCLCPGLTITLNHNGVLSDYYSANGLNDLADDIIKNTEIIENRFNYNWTSGKNSLDLIMTYTSKYDSTIIPYVNTGLTESGPHISLIKTWITREFNKFIKAEGWLKEKEENLSGEDLGEGMVIIFNVTASNVGYDSQVKSRVVKLDMGTFGEPFARSLNIWFANNKNNVKIIVDKALTARRAREAARKAKEGIRNLAQKKEKALRFSSKLADCYSKDRSKCELYITEGGR